jgi:hypothetical protein
MHSHGSSGMHANLGEPIGTRYLPEQLRLIEEAAAMLKVQRYAIIRIGSAFFAKQLLERASGK